MAFFLFWYWIYNTIGICFTNTKKYTIVKSNNTNARERTLKRGCTKRVKRLWKRKENEHRKGTSISIFNFFVNSNFFLYYIYIAFTFSNITKWFLFLFIFLFLVRSNQWSMEEKTTTISIKLWEISTKTRRYWGFQYQYCRATKVLISSIDLLISNSDIILSFKGPPTFVHFQGNNKHLNLLISAMSHCMYSHMRQAQVTVEEGNSVRAAMKNFGKGIFKEGNYYLKTNMECRYLTLSPNARHYYEVIRYLFIQKKQTIAFIY